MATTAQQSLNQLVQSFTLIGNAHQQIKTFGFGQIYHIATSGTINYPVMWAELDHVEDESHTTNYFVNFYVMDVVQNDRSNETNVLSDCILIATDIIAELKHPDWTFDVVVNESVKIDYYTEGMTDKVAGVKWNMMIKIETPDDTCAIPQGAIARF